MVRTRADAGATKVSAAKAPRKVLSGGAGCSSAGSSGAGRTPGKERFVLVFSLSFSFHMYLYQGVYVLHSVCMFVYSCFCLLFCLQLHMKTTLIREQTCLLNVCYSQSWNTDRSLLVNWGTSESISFWTTVQISFTGGTCAVLVLSVHSQSQWVTVTPSFALNCYWFHL